MTGHEASQQGSLDPLHSPRLDEIMAIENEFHDLCAGLSADQLRWQPAATDWSILQCLAHLNRTVAEYLPRIDGGIEQGRSRGMFGSGASRGTRLGAWLIRSIEPPVIRRFKAPKQFQPRVDLKPEEVLADFIRLRDEVRERIKLSNGLDLGRIRISSPALKLLRVSLGQSFEVLAAHDRRHLWQARNVSRQPGFPVR